MGHIHLQCIKEEGALMDIYTIDFIIAFFIGSVWPKSSIKQGPGAPSIGTNLAI